MYYCDISSLDQIRKTAQLTLNDVGKVDIVINNAGIANNYLFADLQEEKLEKIFRVNVLGYAFVTKQFIRSAKQFIIIVSITSKFSAEKASDYTATKHALDGLFEGIRLEQKRLHSGVAITMIYPANLKTQMFAGYYAKNFAFLKSLDVDYVARAIYNAACLKKESIYLPWHTEYVIKVITLLPVFLKDYLLLYITEGSLDKVKQS